MRQISVKTLVASLVASTYLFTNTGAALACTSILVTDKNGRGYHGRTLEYSSAIPTEVTYFPAGTRVVSATPAGKQGITFDTKFAIFGMTAPLVPTAKQVSIAEGMNDQGLSFSMNWLTNSTSPTVGNDDGKILAINDLGAWILGNFKSVAEVKAAMTSGATEFWLPIAPFVDRFSPLPQHYAINDKTGGSLVVEFTNGKTHVYDNPVGVMTNGPEFPWHLQNLSNYTFTNKDKNTGQLGKLKLATQDAGIALTALPSAQTSQGRFVKAAFYANYVRKAKTPDEAIITLGHIMNNFDRPQDLTVDDAGGMGDGSRSKGITSEVTTWTVMNDLSRNLFYFRGINALNWVVIDLNQLKGINQIKTISSAQLDKAGVDVASLFVK